MRQLVEENQCLLIEYIVQQSLGVNVVKRLEYVIAIAGATLETADLLELDTRNTVKNTVVFGYENVSLVACAIYGILSVGAHFTF